MGTALDEAEVEGMMRAAERAAERAGRYLVGCLEEGTESLAKPGTHEHDVVTEADLAAEEMIRSELDAAAPGALFVGEEGAGGGAAPRDPDAEAAEAEVCWFVDPIDGTHNFSRGVPLFCVSIGLSVRGEPAGGCVYEPARDELYTAAGGRLRRNGRPVRALPPARAVPMVLSDVPRPGVVPDPAEMALFTELMGAADVRRIGSAALALAYVATGRAELAVAADVFAWDVAAGRALVTASGGTFVAVPGEPSAVRPGGFVAWRPELADLGAGTVTSLTRCEVR
ncbi:inositol monophosphatase family protein [Actinomadura darangshiensis]|nr:inositol monophosphatase [Actinomadura darangshiensis]